MKLDGKLVAKEITDNLKSRIAVLDEKPTLVVISVGEDKASQSYIKSKETKAKEIGINSIIIKLNKNISENELLEEIDKHNENKSVNGILVQLPLPKHISTSKVLNRIDPEKDVDGFHPTNAGNLLVGNQSLVPCTPGGVIELLEYYNIPLEGQKVVVLGRSNIVGKPLSILLTEKNATVTLAHSFTKNTKELTKQADIVISAIGKPHYIDNTFISDNTTIIDVGINRVNGKIIGDVNIENILETKENINYSPVPGGVGPLTVACLMKQTYLAYLNQF